MPLPRSTAASSPIDPSPVSRVSAAELHERLVRRAASADELAVLDVRDEGPFSRGHILLSVPLPEDRIEVRAPELVPRPSVPIVLVDAGDGAVGDGAAAHAGARLHALGYSAVAVLDGGVSGWRAAGYELVTGTNAITKAFGEAVEQVYGTPHRPAAEVAAMLGSEAPPVVLDSRPPAEFRRMSIPGALNCAGAELAYRIEVAAPDPAVPVVVNCAGRTRSILGAQSLINSGVVHDVVALENGTMGWGLAGLELDHDRTRHVAAPDSDAAATRERAERIRHLFGISVIDTATVSAWRDERDRTLFLLDVRTAGEYGNGHLPGARHAAGGQVVQALDDYVGVWGARVVLVDTAPGTRALMTASWLAQIALTDTHVLVAEPAELTATEPATGSATGFAAVGEIRPDELAAHRADTLVLDLADSLGYEQGHLPGARYARRAEVPGLVAEHPGPVVLTSPDGRIAAVAALDVADRRGSPRVLAGGTEAWRAAGFDLEQGRGTLLAQPDDRWRAPYQLWDSAAAEQAARTYFDWEHDLEAAVERDGTHRFRLPRPGPPRRLPGRRVTRRADELVEQAHRIGADAARDAARRDRERLPPHEPMAAIRAAGLGALRVPAEHGGPGGTVRQLIAVTIALALGDPSLAQVMQAHFIAVERLRVMTTGPDRERHLGWALDGTLFGNASTELSTDLGGPPRTRLRQHPAGTGLAVSGTKFYTTGGLLADELLVTALDPDDQPVYLVLPRHRPGLILEEDWDGFGQRGTASGTTTLDDVAVLAEDVVPLGRWRTERHHTGSISQLLHAAIDAGIAAAAARDAVDRARAARPVAGSGLAHRHQDPAVRHTVGRVSHLARRAELVVLAAADEIDRVEALLALPDTTATDREAALVGAALETANAKIAANDSALEASTAMFEVGGASGTRAELALDRHWRNARTHTLHDPVADRYRVLGDWLLDGTAPPISFTY